MITNTMDLRYVTKTRSKQRGFELFARFLDCRDSMFLYPSMLVCLSFYCLHPQPCPINYPSGSCICTSTHSVCLVKTNYTIRSARLLLALTRVLPLHFEILGQSHAIIILTYPFSDCIIPHNSRNTERHFV